MIDSIVKSVSFSYSSFEDRLLLRCVIGAQCHDLWMTQLMIKQLVPLVVNWVQESGGSHSTALIGKTFRYAKSSNAPKTSQLAENAERASAVNTKPPESSTGEMSPKESVEKSISSVWLCSIASISSDDKRIRIRIGSNKSIQAYVFSMTVLEAGYFLLAQKKALQNIYWPISWPEWLESEDACEVSTHANFLH